jgi:monofunctional biosynthetic peptidoglycan transglycosylase
MFTPKRPRRRSYILRDSLLENSLADYPPRRRSRFRFLRYGLFGLLGLIVASVLAVLCLRWLPPPTSAFMLQYRVSTFSERGPQHPLRYQWVKWESISPYMPLAAIAAEDQKFPEHWGFDFESIAEAVEENEEGGRVRGASTITQQVAKNLFLWSGRSYVRKGLEAYFAVLIEALWPKQRILEVYVNIAEFGEGTYGVYAASARFFSKRPNELSRSEAARLAAVLPNPKRFNAGNPSAYVMNRRFWIEDQMEQLGGPEFLGNL